ncbi:unnamed protein product, partial [Cladocopium goreaui]
LELQKPGSSWTVENRGPNSSEPAQDAKGLAEPSETDQKVQQAVPPAQEKQGAGAGPNTWRKATEAELREVLFASQFDGESGNCSYDFKHACLGRPRGTRHMLGSQRDVLKASQIWTKGGRSDQHALEPLDKLLRHIAVTPPCMLTLVGDSTTTDFFVATLLGAFRLGWQRTYWCGQFGASYLHGENLSVELINANCSGFSKYFTQVWMLKAAHPEVALHPKCKRLSLLLHVLDSTTVRMQQQRAERLLWGSTYLLLNWGLRKNDKPRLITAFNEVVKPFLDTRRFDKLLWRTTLPQHFVSHDGSGLWAAAKKVRKKVDFRGQWACGPITNVPASNWRNIEFSKWLRSQLGPEEASRLRQVDANEYFVERYDLHTAPDCTHYLYSPFAYFHLWDAFREALKI